MLSTRLLRRVAWTGAARVDWPSMRRLLVLTLFCTAVRTAIIRNPVHTGRAPRPPLPAPQSQQGTDLPQQGSSSTAHATDAKAPRIAGGGSGPQPRGSMQQLAMQQIASRNRGGVLLAADARSSSSSSRSYSARSSASGGSGSSSGGGGGGGGGGNGEGEGKRGRLRTLCNQLIRLPKQSSVADIEAMLSDQHLVAHNLTTLLLTLKKRGKWRPAALIADWAEMDSCPLQLTTTHYNLVLSACSRRAPKRALHLLSRMLEKGVPTNVVTHNTAMSAALNADDHSQALALFDQMQSLNLEPTTISFNTAITACARAGDADRALGLFRQMEGTGIERSTVTYTGLIHACAEGGQLDKAMALFTYMDVAGVERNPVTYCVAINGCTRNGQWELGLQLLHEMARKGVR